MKGLSQVLRDREAFSLLRKGLQSLIGGAQAEEMVKNWIFSAQEEASNLDRRCSSRGNGQKLDFLCSGRAIRSWVGGTQAEEMVKSWIFSAQEGIFKPR